jgi:hypothetical protein
LKTVKQILLTFDYEPYLGVKTGSAKKCILEPTEALISILDKYKTKGVFFVDILYLKNLKKHQELNEDLAAITSQLKRLNEKGHYVFPHLHPHWLDAEYITGKKEFSLKDLTHYSIANLEVAQIKKLFRESIEFLNSIRINHEKWGYRAGGWCIQPFHLFKDIFREENICYEFSVLPGYKNENKNQAFDFSTFTKNTPYFFSETVEKPENSGPFIEFPISTIEFNAQIRFKDRLVRKYLWKTNDKGWGDGTSAQTAQLKSIYTDREMASIELLTIAKLSTYKKQLKNTEHMHWISHPKLFTRHGLKTFDSFLEFATNKFAVTSDFKEMVPEKI